MVTIIKQKSRKKNHFSEISTAFKGCDSFFSPFF